jgi:hypothetical protein
MSGTSRADIDVASEDINEFLEPLVPVSEVASSKLPVESIQPSRLEALSVVGAKRAKDSRGTISDHEQGIFGEFAVAKYFGIPNQIDKEIYENGDPGYDIVYRKKKIDVKTVGGSVNNPFLPVSTYGELHADYYVLVQQLNRSNYRIFGYAHRLQVLQSHTIKFTHRKLHSPDRFDNEVYSVEQDRLIPIGRIDR